MLTQRQENRYLAYDNLYQALKRDPSIYQQDVAFRDIVERIERAVKGIVANRGIIGEHPTKGVTKDKTAAKTKLITVAAELAGDLFAYATKNKNAVLQAESQLSKSYLRDISGVRLISLTTMLRERLTEHAAALEAYAVSASRLQEFDDAFDAYDQQRNGPRLQVGKIAAVRITVNRHFDTLADLVKDELMPSLRKYERQAPEFFVRVISAREVIDLTATRKRKDVKGDVGDVKDVETPLASIQNPSTDTSADS